MRPEEERFNQVDGSSGSRRIRFAPIRPTDLKQRSSRTGNWRNLENWGDDRIQGLLDLVRQNAMKLWKQRQPAETVNLDDCSDGNDSSSSNDEETAHFPNLPRRIRCSGAYLESQLPVLDPQHFEPQFGHLDFAPEKINEFLDKYEGAIPLHGHVPVSEDGTMLHVWTTDEDGQLKDMYILYIPYGVGILLPGDLFHGGGFLFGKNKNERIHLCLVPGGGPHSRSILDGIDEYIHHYPQFDRKLHFDECLLRRLKFYLLGGDLPTGANSLSTMDVFDPIMSDTPVATVAEVADSTPGTLLPRTRRGSAGEELRIRGTKRARVQHV